MRFSAIEKLSRIVNLLFTCASQPPFAANHHVIIKCRSNTHSRYNVTKHVRVEHGDLHYGNCVLGQALHLVSLVDRMDSWLLGKTILPITVAVLPILTAHSWHMATTLSEDVGSRPEVSITIYQNST